MARLLKAQPRAVAASLRVTSGMQHERVIGGNSIRGKGREFHFGEKYFLGKTPAGFVLFGASQRLAG